MERRMRGKRVMGQRVGMRGQRMMGQRVRRRTGGVPMGRSVETKKSKIWRLTLDVALIVVVIMALIYWSVDSSIATEAGDNLVDVVGEETSGVDILDRFSDEEKDQILEIKGAYRESGGMEVVGLLEFFEANSDRVDDMIYLCENGIISGPIRCHRFLAISIPDERESICDAIDIGDCDYYSVPSGCRDLVDVHVDECKLLVPLVG